MTNSSERKLAWLTLDPATLNKEVQKANDERIAANAAKREKDAKFEELVRKHHDAGLRASLKEAIKDGMVDLSKEIADPEAAMIFGFNFGRIAVAFPEEQKRGVSKGKRTLKV